MKPLWKNQSGLAGERQGRYKLRTERGREKVRVWSIIEDAGWPVWPLLAASVIAVALIFERLVSLRRSKIIPADLLDEVLRALSAQGAGLTSTAVDALETHSPLGRILAAPLRCGSASRAVLQDALQSAGSAVHHELTRYLSALATIATVAPLMGLFGTVIGMIEIFAAQAPSGLNPEQLARGISIALYNTAFGILVAIPATLFHRLFKQRVDDYTVALEQAAARLLNAIRPE